MARRGIGVAFAALVGCTNPKPEQATGTEPLTSASASSSASAAQPSASAVVSPNASASAPVDVSYPDDTIPAPSPSSSARLRVDQVALDGVIKEYVRQGVSLTRGATKEGVVLRGLQPDSVLVKIGLRNGDLLRDINGLKMAEPDEAVDSYAKLRRARRFDIHIERDGKPMTFILEAK